MVAPLLGADQSQDLRCRIEGNAVTGPIPACHLLPKGEHPLLLVGRITVVFRFARRPAQLVDDRIRCRFDRIADRQADHVHAVGLGLGDLLSQFHEQVGRNLRQTFGCLQRRSPFAMGMDFQVRGGQNFSTAMPRPTGFPDRPWWFFLPDKLSRIRSESG